MSLAKEAAEATSKEREGMSTKKKLALGAGALGLAGAGLAARHYSKPKIDLTYTGDASIQDVKDMVRAAKKQGFRYSLRRRA